MSGHKLILLILSFPLFAIQENIDQHYKEGLKAYKNNQYDLAIQEFETILDSNWLSSQLYYNLGNAYYQNENIADAIWAYESSLILSPNHKDSKYNLKLANLKVKDRLDLPVPPIYLKWYMAIKERYTPSVWLNFTLFFFLLLSCSLTFSRLFKITLKYIPGILITFIFISIFFTLNAIYAENSINQGIINSVSIEARSEPNLISTRLFEVHEGLKVKVLANQKYESWVKIELLDGKTGWIERDLILLIQ